MHLQENIVLSFVEILPCTSVKCEVATSKGRGVGALARKKQYLPCYLDFWVNVSLDIARYPLHHLTFVPTQLEVATSIG